MKLITGLYSIDSCQTVFSEKFQNNRRNWEIVDSETEQANITDGYYHMLNKTYSRWNYYSTGTGLNSKQEFLIDCMIELENNIDHFGHFGLLWGYGTEREYLNRFSLSSNGKRLVVAHFQKDHHVICHRFYNPQFLSINTQQPVRFTIIRLGSYFHFYLNSMEVYMAHVSLFCDEGHNIGFYVEPKLRIRSNFLEVKKIKATSLPLLTGLQQLMHKVPL